MNDHASSSSAPEGALSRLRAFLRYWLRRFLEEDCFSAAGALSYATVFALVPLTAAVLGILTAFPVFETWADALSDWLFTHFVPEAARTVEAYIQEFAASATRLTVAGVLASILSALIMMASVEDALNRIFRVRKARRTAVRLTMYWTVLTLGPLLVAGGLALSSEVVQGALGEGAAPSQRLAPVLGALPLAVVFLGFTMAYVVVPNTQVPFRHAAIGAALATTLFWLAKWGFSAYLARWPTYQQIYGAVAVVPIFLLWIYLAWVVVLLGASLAASLSAFRLVPREKQLGEGVEFYALLRVALALAEAQRHGRGLSLGELRRQEPYLDDHRLLALLEGLNRRGVVLRTETGEWVLARDPSGLSLAVLYESGPYRVPTSLPPLPGQEDPRGAAARRLLERLSADTKRGLSISLAELPSAAEGLLSSQR